MKSVTVRWEITEEHQATIQVEDDFDTDDDDLDLDQWLADNESNDSWLATTERTLLEFTINDDNDEKAGN